MTGGPAAAILGLPKFPPGLPREVTIQFVAALIARCCVIATLVAGLPAGCRAQAHRGHQDAAEMGAMDSTDQHVTGAAHDAMSGPLGADPHMLLTPPRPASPMDSARSEEHTSELQSRLHLVCRLLLEKKKEHCLPRTIS